MLDDGLGGGEGRMLGSTAAIFKYGLIGGAAGVLAQVATKGLAWVLIDKFGVGDSAACKAPNYTISYANTIYNRSRFCSKISIKYYGLTLFLKDFGP